MTEDFCNAPPRKTSRGFLHKEVLQEPVLAALQTVPIFSLIFGTHAFTAAAVACSIFAASSLVCGIFGIVWHELLRIRHVDSEHALRASSR